MMEKHRYYNDVFRGRRKSSPQKVGTISPVVEKNGDMVTIKIPSNLITTSSRTSLSVDPKEHLVSSPPLDEMEEENTKEIQAEEIYPRIPRRLSFNRFEESGVRDNPGMRVFNLKVYYSEIVIDGALKTYPETKVSTIVSPLLANRSHFVNSIRKKLQSFGVNPHTRLTVTPIPSLPDDREYSVAHWMKRFPGAAFVVSPKHELDALYSQLVALKGGRPATRNPFYAVEPQVTPIDYRAEEHIAFASPSGDVETAQTGSSPVGIESRGSRISVMTESWAVTGQDDTGKQNRRHYSRGEESFATPGSWSDSNSRATTNVMMNPETLSSSSRVVMTGRGETNQENVRYQKQGARESPATFGSWPDTDRSATTNVMMNPATLSASSWELTGQQESNQENIRFHSSHKRDRRGSIATVGSSSSANTDDMMVSATMPSATRAVTGQGTKSQEFMKTNLTMNPEGRDGTTTHGRTNEDPNPSISLTVHELIESHRRELEMLQEKLLHTTSQLMRLKKDHATDIHDVVESHRADLRVMEEKLLKATSQLMDMEKDHFIKDTTIRSLEQKLEEYNHRINEVEQALRFTTVESYQARLRDVYRRMFLECVRKKLRAKLRVWFTSPSPVDYHLVSYEKVIETCEQMEDLEKHLGLSREAVRLTLEDASLIWDGVHDNERIHIGIYAEMVHSQPPQLAVAYRTLFFFLYNQEPETVLDNLIKSWTRKPFHLC